jgi:hypothetical protein
MEQSQKLPYIHEANKNRSWAQWLGSTRGSRVCTTAMLVFLPLLGAWHFGGWNNVESHNISHFETREAAAARAAVIKKARDTFLAGYKDDKICLYTAPINTELTSDERKQLVLKIESILDAKRPYDRYNRYTS